MPGAALVLLKSAAASSASALSTMTQKFRDLAVLELSEEDWHRRIPVGPAEELKHGHLENGMRYILLQSCLGIAMTCIGSSELAS